MSLEILKLTLGPLQTNAYIIGDPASRAAVVIDPVDRASLLLETATRRGWQVREILATHAHFDHIMASRELKERTGAAFRLHRLDMPLLKQMPQRVKAWISIDVGPAAEPDSFVEEGDRIEVGAIALDVLFTPGHAPGHVSYVLASEQTVFSGDVLFHHAIGRTDLPGCDYEDLMQSILGKLLPLGDEFTVAPGHMQNTTIAYERQHNPYILDYLSSRGE